MLLLSLVICQWILQATEGRTVLYIPELDPPVPPTESTANAYRSGVSPREVADDPGWRRRKDLHLLTSFKSNCVKSSDRFEFHVGPKFAVMCPFLRDMRARCLATPEYSAPFIGRNCRGQTCTLKVEGGSDSTTSCLFEFFGVSVDSSNTSRTLTCGLDPEEAKLILSQDLAAALPFHSNDSGCVRSVPDRVNSSVNLQCKDGLPQLEVGLTFSDPMPDDNYTCIVNPVCSPRLGYQSHFLCYAGGGEGVELGDLGYDMMDSRAARRDGLCFGEVFWLVLLAWVMIEANSWP